MKSIKFQRNGDIINFKEEDKKFIAESRITPNTNYTTTEWLRFQGERFFLLVSQEEAEAEKMKFLLMTTGD